MYYDLPVTLPSFLTDRSGVASATTLLSLMQEAAYREDLAYGPSDDELREQGMAFVLSRIGCAFYAPVRAGDDITVRTWSCDSRGMSFPRCTRILRGDEIVAEASAVWALIRLEDRSLVRASEIALRYTNEPPLEEDIPKRVVFPAGTDLPLIGEKTVLRSDTDRNLHMNNARYADLLLDHLPALPDGQRVVRLALSYLREAKLGDVLKIYGLEQDETYYFRVMLPGTVCAEAALVLDELD